MAKMFVVVLMVLFSCMAVDCARTSDYCKRTLCQEGLHIGCGNKNKFALTCPKDAKLVTGSNLKKHFIEEHNRIRSEVGLGRLPGFKSAMRMATVQWDAELEKLAQMLVKTCVSKYDECRNTERYSTVGQNIATTAKIGSYSVPLLIKETVNGWFKEHENADSEYVTRFKLDSRYEDCRHFMQLVTDKTTKIGCAIIEFTEGTRTRVNTVCNYSSRPLNNTPVYIEGCATAQCLKGHNKDFAGLCTPTETVFANHYL